MSLPSPQEIRDILNDNCPQRLEAMAQEARRITRHNFGMTMGLYTPLYLSNHCDSHCTYCGFRNRHKIQRTRLSIDEIRAEMKAIAAAGIRNILLLTGESPHATPLSYLVNAIQCATEFFQGISLEVYPMATSDYRALYTAGADGVTIYQETYDRARYAQVHLAGQKQDFTFRYQAPERIAQAGMRQITLGILLGLGPVADDMHALFTHLHSLEKKYPGVEYSLSFPRLRTVRSKAFTAAHVDDASFVKILCLTRLSFPRIGINLSTREPAALRNRLLEICTTRISVGSKTGVGGYHNPGDDHDPQFDVADERNSAEMIQYLKTHGIDPVFTDWRRIENT